MQPYTTAENPNRWVKDALKFLGFNNSSFARYYQNHRNTVANWQKDGHPVPQAAILVLNGLIQEAEKTAQLVRESELRSLSGNQS